MASGSTVSNSGILSSNFLNGYGISFGVNGRSQNGGNSVINTATGSINTLQTNSDGIRILASKATSLGNTAINNGVITTKANRAIGISVNSGANVVMNHTEGYEFLAGQLSVDGTSALSIDKPIFGASSITKIGDGTLTLAADNLYTGGTTVEIGTLNLTGSVASDVAISSASTLSY